MFVVAVDGSYEKYDHDSSLSTYDTELPPLPLHPSLHATNDATTAVTMAAITTKQCMPLLDDRKVGGRGMGATIPRSCLPPRRPQV